MDPGIQIWIQESRYGSRNPDMDPGIQIHKKNGLLEHIDKSPHEFLFTKNTGFGSVGSLNLLLSFQLGPKSK